MGAYSPSAGLRIVRCRVAEYIEARDGVPASPDDIYLGSGASDVIKAVLTMLVGNVDFTIKHNKENIIIASCQ